MAQVQYSVKQSKELALGVIETLKYGNPLSEEQLAFLRWLCARVHRWSDNLLARIEQLPPQIEALVFQTPAARTVLLMDVDEMPTMTPDQREKAKERLQRALSSKPPTEAKKNNGAAAANVSGRTFTLPPRFQKKAPDGSES